MEAMILLLPGPTPVPTRILDATARPVVGHRTPEFEAILAECADGLRRVFRTGEGPVLSIPGSGTASMEAAMLSLVRPGDSVLTCASGKFGTRWHEVYRRASKTLGLEHRRIDVPWGEPVTAERIAEDLRERPGTSVVVVVHCETSTGALSDIRAIAAAVREHAPDALLIADCISSLAAERVETEEWGIDAVVCGSQKALMLPPGLGFVGLGERALARLGGGEGVAPLYLDLRWHLQAHEKGSPPCTPPVNLVFGLKEALSMLLERGMEDVWETTHRRAEAVRAAAKAMGLAVAPRTPSDSLTVMRFPAEGMADAVRAGCKRRGVVVAGGQDEWKGWIVRMSHMGAVTDADLVAGVDAIADSLEELGAPAAVHPAAGRAAIREAFGASAQRDIAGSIRDRGL